MAEPIENRARTLDWEARRKALRARMRAQPQLRAPLVGPDHKPGRARPKRQARIVSDPLALSVPS